jgi:uncharacterized membrane protein (UPF0127 family)
MRVVVNPGGDDERVIASDVDVADSFLSQTVGLMGKSSIPEDYALVFEFDGVARRFIHMLFVRMPLDVLWIDDDEVIKTKQLRPWTGVGMGKSDRIIELPAGAAADVAPGDTIAVTDDSDTGEDTAADDEETNPVAEAIDEAAEKTDAASDGSD